MYCEYKTISRVLGCRSDFEVIKVQQGFSEKPLFRERMKSSPWDFAFWTRKDGKTPMVL